MARKRMFDNEIINQDSFLDLPMEAKALYFLLGMEADDEGFVSPKKVLRLYGGTNESLKILISKNFIILFHSGIVAITDWKRNNYIDKNKTKETIYQAEKKQLIYNPETQKYQWLNESLTKVEPKLNESLPRIEENRIEENSIDKNSIVKNNIPAFEDKSSTASAKANDIIALKDEELQNKEEPKKKEAVKHKYGTYKNVLLKDSELDKLKQDYSNWKALIKYLDEYIEMKGYKAKSHYLCIKKWVVDAVKRQNKNTAQEEFLNE